MENRNKSNPSEKITPEEENADFKIWRTDKKYEEMDDGKLREQHNYFPTYREVMEALGVEQAQKRRNPGSTGKLFILWCASHVWL